MCTKPSSLSCHSACLSMPFPPSHMSNYTTNNQRHIQTNYQNAHDLRLCGDIGRGLLKWNNSYNLREFGIREIRYVSYPYEVVDEITIDFSPNRVQQASYPMPSSHKSRDEFGIKAIRYANYRYAEVGESAIRFLSNRVQKNHRFLSRIHVKQVFSSPRRPKRRVTNTS